MLTVCPAQCIDADTLCVCAVDYPWRWRSRVLMNSALIKWIYLPDFYTVPNSKNLIGQCTQPGRPRTRLCFL